MDYLSSRAPPQKGSPESPGAASSACSSANCAASASSRKERPSRAAQNAALIEAVLDAVRSGNDEPVLKLLQEGVNVDAKDIEGRTPLIIASRDNRPTTAKLLLTHKANVNAKTKLQATALLAAATHGHAGIVKMLLSAGADRNAGVNGMRPIDVARRYGKADVVALLLREGQPNWGSGQPRLKEKDTTGKQHHALSRLSSNMEEGQADSFDRKITKHRERVMRLKDER